MTGGKIKVHMGCTETVFTCDLATQQCTGGDGKMTMSVVKGSLGYIATLQYANSTALVGADEFTTSGPTKEIYFFQRPGNPAFTILHPSPDFACEDAESSKYLTPPIQTDPKVLEETASPEELSLTINFKEKKIDASGEETTHVKTIVYAGTYTLVKDGGNYTLTLDVSQKDVKYPLTIKKNMTLTEAGLAQLKIKFYSYDDLKTGSQKIFLFDESASTAEEIKGSEIPAEPSYKDWLAFLGTEPFSDPMDTATRKSDEMGISLLDALKYLAMIKWKQLIAKKLGELPTDLKSVKTFEAFCKVLGIPTTSSFTEINTAVDKQFLSPPASSDPAGEIGTDTCPSSQEWLAFLGTEPFSDPMKKATEKSGDMKISVLDALKFLAMIKWKHTIAKKYGALPADLKDIKTFADFCKVLGVAATASVADINKAVDAKYPVVPTSSDNLDPNKKLLGFLGNDPFFDPMATAKRKMADWGCADITEALGRLAVIKWRQQVTKILGTLPEYLAPALKYGDFAKALGLSESASIEEITATIQKLKK